MKNYVARDILLYFSLKYEGNWIDIFDAIKRKEKIDEDEYDVLVSQNKANYVTILDSNYPMQLKNIYQPPFVLYYYGDWDLTSQKGLAVIGSRVHSAYAKENCIRIVTDLVPSLVIISGMARGIDSIAHQSAINAGGKTIAILGSGIENCYPKENRQLFDAIKRNHLLISEYPGDTEPNSKNFPCRNRIIAGLAEGVFVVEAKQRSGSMITVASALEKGKDVYCLPHNVDGELYCNSLIKDGAYLVEDAKDILDNMK